VSPGNNASRITEMQQLSDQLRQMQSLVTIKVTIKVMITTKHQENSKIEHEHNLWHKRLLVFGSVLALDTQPNSP